MNDISPADRAATEEMVSDLSETILKPLLLFVDDAFSWLGQIATTVSGYSTLAVAVLTYLLWLENRRLRKMGSDPQVVAHFEINPEGTGALNMALSNVGKGPALDVSFTFDVDQEDFEKYEVLVDYARERSAATVIPQGEKISFIFAVGFDLFRPKGGEKGIPLKPFKVTVRWRSHKQKSFISETYVLDVSQYTGLPGMMSKPPLLRVKDELAGIKSHLSKLSGRVIVSPEWVDTTKVDQDFRAVVKGGSGEVAEDECPPDNVTSNPGQ